MSRGSITAVAIVLSLMPVTHADDFADRVAAAQARLADKQRAATRAATRPASRPALPAATKPATAPMPTIGSVLLQLPPADRPTAAHGWDEFSLPKARKLLNERLVGQPYEWEATITSVSIDRIPATRDRNETAAWQLNIIIAPKQISVFGTPVSVTVSTFGSRGFGSGGLLTIEVDEATARAARDWPKRGVIGIKGTVAEVTDEGAWKDQTFNVALSGHQLTRTPSSVNAKPAP